MPFKYIIDTIFAASLFINAALFVPQMLKIYQEKSSEGVSLIMFVGFILIQFSAVLYGVVHHDPILIFGYLLSMICCGGIIVIALIYRKNRIEIAPNR